VKSRPRRKLLSQSQVARALGISRQRVHQLVQAGRLEPDVDRGDTERTADGIPLFHLHTVRRRKPGKPWEFTE